MSSPQSPGNDAGFNDRLQRLAEKHAPREAERAEVRVVPDWKENIRYPAALIGAAFVGALGVLVARYARYHLMGGSLVGDDVDITMVIDAGIAAACSFLIFGLLRFSGPEFKLAQTVGIFAMVCVMHNFVHAAPKVFDTLFSEQWTDEVIAYTEPKSILFRGMTFAMDAEAAVAEADFAVPNETATPTILRLN